jgi:hypothetical protein
MLVINGGDRLGGIGMTWRAAAIAAAFVVTGCAAAPYLAQPAPRAWRGEAGMRPIPSTLEMFEGRRAEGDVILRYEVAPARTGRLAEAVVYDDGALPAGAPLYADQFSPTLPGPFDNPVTWCAVLPDRPPVCMFWISPDAAYYASAEPPGMIFSWPRMASTGRPIAWASGPAPTIADEAVDFGRRSFIEIRLEDIDSAGVRLAGDLVEVDEAGRRRHRELGVLRYLYWDPYGRVDARIMGGDLRLAAIGGDAESDPEAVTVVVEQAPPDPGAPRVSVTRAEEVCADLALAVHGGAPLAAAFANEGSARIVGCGVEDDGSWFAYAPPGAPRFAQSEEDVSGEPASHFTLSYLPPPPPLTAPYVRSTSVYVPSIPVQSAPLQVRPRP